MAIKTDQTDMSKVTIIMYHYVRDLQNSRYPQIKGLDTHLFNEQIKYVNKFYNVVSMEEVVHAIDTGDSLPPKAALLTFDDGYLDHYVNVLPILDQYNFKGCFFIPAKAIAEHTVLDVNKIHFVLASVSDKSLIVDELKTLLNTYRAEYNLQSFEYYYSKLATESRFDTKEVIFIKRLLQVELFEELRAKMVDELFKKYIDIPESVFSRELYMDMGQLKHMKKLGMHIGCHGYNHFWWNSLTKSELENELDRSLGFLREVGIDLDNWTACYPYGSFDDQAVEVLKNYGCKMAVTTKVKVADIKNDSRFLLPRLDTNDMPKMFSRTPDHWYQQG
jgi:peptidoglycan/xylan/chitin deacetylase (PgdA/CDA1 family)